MLTSDDLYTSRSTTTYPVHRIHRPTKHLLTASERLDIEFHAIALTATVAIAVSKIEELTDKCVGERS